MFKTLSLLALVGSTEAIHHRHRRDPLLAAKQPGTSAYPLHKDSGINWPTNYFVPNFGPVDSDIVDTKGHIVATEKKHKHKLNLGNLNKELNQENWHKENKLAYDYKDFPTAYKVPSLGVDEDIKGTKSSL